MGSSPKVEVENRILLWARETSGLDIPAVARKVGTKPARVQEWEEGHSQPTIKQLRKLARAYMRPVGLFFLSELPEDPESIKDFRKIPDEFAEEMSSALRFEIRLAQDRRDEALELMSDLDEEPPTIGRRFHLNDDPDRVAAELRRFLGVSIHAQTRWRTKYEAFSSWRSAIEEKGTLVFQTGVLRNLIVLPKEARGFSIAEQPYPVIVVNGKDHHSARCFTLIHELAHILLDDGGLCDLHNPSRALSEIDRTEVFCNRVAGSTLVPADTLIGTEVVRDHGIHSDWGDDELATLARMFWVSWEVILRRLLILGRTTSSFYERWRHERDDLFPGPDAPATTEIKIPAPITVIMRNGRLFPTLVLQALRDRRITSFEASDILGTGPHRLGDIEGALF